MTVEKAYGEYTDFRIPGIVATESGSLIRYCECRRGASDWASIDIKVARSEDGGETWNAVLLLEGGGDTLNNPVMISDGGRLVFLYCKNYRELWKCVSEDDGKSFTAPERVCFEKSAPLPFTVVAVGPGHGITHKGRLLIPVWFAYNEQNEKAHSPSFIATLYSTDRGESWQVGEVIFKEALKNPSECALAVDAAGEVLISIRHEGEQRTRALAKSADGVSAWRDLRFEENLSDPVCMGSMTHRGGVIYHSNCDSATNRKDLTVKISDNGFGSYRGIPISKLGGYSDIALLGDTLCILYEKTVPNENGGDFPPAKPFELFFEKIKL